MRFAPHVLIVAAALHSNIDNNQLSGSIPSSLDNLKNLTLWSTRNNRLTGNLPASFANVTKLAWLYEIAVAKVDVRCVPTLFFSDRSSRY
jgi:hypothetical protein